MAKRPELSLEEQAELERLREAFFRDAAPKFDLLFFPMLHMLDLSPLSVIATGREGVPQQRMQANLKLQLQRYSGALFDMEAQFHFRHTPDHVQLRLWLEDLAIDIEKEVEKICCDTRHDVHCNVLARVIAVKDGLKKRVDHFVQHKKSQLAKIAAGPRYEAESPTPVRSMGIVGTVMVTQPHSIPAPKTAKAVKRNRLSKTIKSDIAARRLEAFLDASPIEKTVFARNAGTTERTLLRFRRTGRISRKTLADIAIAMGTTLEELIKPD